MARQDSRHRSPEKDRDAECTYSSQIGTIKIDRLCYQNKYFERLPKKIFYGELRVRKHSHGGQKKRYKDTLKTSLKDFKIPTGSWEQIAKDRAKRRGLKKKKRVLVNTRQKELAKPSRNMRSRKPELRHHQQSFLPQTSLVLSATDSFELRLVSSAILHHTNNNTSRIWFWLVIVSNDRRTNTLLELKRRFGTSKFDWTTPSPKSR